MARETVYLLDTSFFIFRAYHALPPLTTSKGLATNAIHGVSTMLEKLIRDRRPVFLGACFDTARATFRRDLFPAYKANRAEPEEDLRVQFPYVRRLVAALEIPVLDREGFEADDILATLARRYENEGYDVVLVTGDKDLMQCVTDHTTLLDPMRDVAIAHEQVVEKFGVGPESVPDVLGLMGDSSDNIPGVKGVGPKTASALVAHFGTIEAMLANTAEIETLPIRGAASVRRRIEEGADMARLCRVLAEVKRDVPVEVGPDQLRVGHLATDELARLAEELEMHRLVPRMQALAVEAGLAPAVPRPPAGTASGAAGTGAAPGAGAAGAASSADRTAPVQAAAQGELGFGRPSPPAADESPAGQAGADRQDLGDLADGVDGLAVAAAPGVTGRLVVAWAADGEGAAFAMGQAGCARATRDPSVAARALVQAATAGLSLQGYDLKGLVREFGAVVGPDALDLGLLSYLCDPEAGDHSPEDVCARFLGEEAAADPVSAEALGQAARVGEVLLAQVEARQLLGLYRDLELPLLSILGRLEAHGVLVDREALAAMSKEFEGRMAALVEKVYAAAGVTFNILSPVQLRELLYEKLALPTKGIKKTKTGLSTDSDALESLAPLHPLPALVLEYRGLAKLKSTYVDALPRLADAGGRIHTRLHQTVAATGRLSSSDPNLQNIPVRTEEGARIRAAFVAPPGCRLLSADYNQIELRVLAHLSADENLCEAFRSGQDIHTATSADMFEVEPAAVTPAMRREAKVVNYGIVYGMGSQRLSRELGISREKAEDYIKRYFAKYPKVQEFYRSQLEHARDHGYVSTLMGRRRYLPDIASDHGGRRQLAERVATNTPIQGSAADIIKKAMVDLDRALAASGLAGRLVLQIHDELLLEVPTGEVEQTRDLVVRVMEGAASLRVPVVADVGAGGSWAEAH